MKLYNSYTPNIVQTILHFICIYIYIIYKIVSEYKPMTNLLFLIIFIMY